MENYKIILGDALTELKKIKDDSIDCIITDPPYKNIRGGHQENKQVNRPGGILKNNDGKIFKNNDICISDWINECYRILKNNTHIYIMTNFLNLFEYVKEIEKVGFILHNLLVWEKNNATPNRWYMKNAEYIIFARKGAAKPINNCGSKTVLEYKNVKNKIHPTEKPIELLKELTMNSSNSGDIILDPFGGSMSTAEAALLLGRKIISFELDQEYYEKGLERVKKIEFGKEQEAKKQIKLTANQQAILNFLQLNRGRDYTARQLAEELNLPIKTCSGCFTPLISAGLIKKTNSKSPFRVEII